MLRHFVVLMPWVAHDAVVCYRQTKEKGEVRRSLLSSVRCKLCHNTSEVGDMDDQVEVVRRELCAANDTNRYEKR